MTKLFTSDGVSGRAITELSCETVMKIGRALALILQNRSGRRAKILIADDGRLSGEIFVSSLAAGCCSAGANAHILGTVPTAAVSYLCDKYSADAGVMITAAHNSFEFNGIKVFDSRGYGLSQSLWAETERLVTSAPKELECTGGENIGSIVYEKNAEWDYVRGLIKLIDADLGRMRIAIDCANGAAFGAAEKFFRGIGTSITILNNVPDGKNINDGCGSQNLEALQKCVLQNRCHAGLAFDGDAGRCRMVDEKGEPVDGDRMTAILAYAMKREQKLSSNTCVVSQTTNLGFFRWAKENGIVVSQAPEVGCRYIIDRMLTGDYNLGGSRSGHIILADYRKTPDGLLAGAKILEILAESGKKMSDLANIFEPYPQEALNIPLRPEYVNRWQDVPALKEVIEFCTQKLEGDGRVLVRQSATSPILRIAVEGRDKDVVWQYAHAIGKTAADYVGLEDIE